MPLECINPDDLPIPEMYTQVVVATGSKLVFVSGQQPEDINGKLVGHGDFAAQARLAFGNLGRALAAAGARPEQVCRSQSMSSIRARRTRADHRSGPDSAVRRSQTSKRSGRDSDDVPRLPDRGRCDRGHRPHHRKLRNSHAALHQVRIPISCVRPARRPNSSVLGDRLPDPQIPSDKRPLNLGAAKSRNARSLIGKSRALA